MQKRVVNLENFETCVVADIPGLIKGAHRGAGLGLKFLRHIERTNVLVILVDLSRVDKQDPGKDYEIIINEFENYNPLLLKKPHIIALNKVDLLSSKSTLTATEAYFHTQRLPFVTISALTGKGIQSLLTLIRKTMVTVT